jgi:hypothetical protein
MMFDVMIFRCADVLMIFDVCFLLLLKKRFYFTPPDTMC